MCSAQDQRSRFDIKVAELRAAQEKNVRMFTVPSLPKTRANIHTEAVS